MIDPAAPLPVIAPDMPSSPAAREDHAAALDRFRKSTARLSRAAARLRSTARCPETARAFQDFGPGLAAIAVEAARIFGDGIVGEPLPEDMIQILKRKAA